MDVMDDLMRQAKSIADMTNYISTEKKLISYNDFTCCLDDLKGYKRAKEQGGILVFFGTFEVLVKGNYQDFDAKVKKANG